jgi:hypothetical protein
MVTIAATVANATTDEADLPTLPADYVPDFSDPPPGLRDAPSGSCAADPRQSHCWPTYMIVTDDNVAITGDGEYLLPPGWRPPAVDLPGDETKSREPALRHTRTRLQRADDDDDEETGYGFVPFARSADGNSCHVRTNHPTRPDDAVKARAENVCDVDSRIFGTELYESLFVRHSGNWGLKKQNSDTRVGGGQVDVTASVHCGNRNMNAWGARAFAATNILGVLYTGSNPRSGGVKQAGVDCGGT